MLKAAWPAGVPAAEMTILDRLPEGRRRAAIARLASVVGGGVAAGFGGGSAGGEPTVSRATVFRLRSAWRREASLRAILPTSFRGARPRAGVGTAMSAVVRRLLAESPAFVSSSAIAREVVAILGGEVAVGAALRSVRRERALMVEDPARLEADFGRGVVVDVTAMSLGTGVESALICLVVERSSGLIVGSAVGLAASWAPLMFAAVGDAAAKLAGGGIDRAVDEGVDTTVSVLVPAPRTPGEFEISERVAGYGRAPGVRFSKARPGELATSVLGGRVGAVRFRPRSTRAVLDAADAAAMPLDLLEVDAGVASIVGRQIAEHNQVVIRRLSISAGDGTLTRDGSGAMAAALARLGRALREEAGS